MRRVSTLDIAAVGIAAWWVRGVYVRAQLRAKFKRIEAAAPEQAAAVRKTWPEMSAGVDSAESVVVPVLLLAYVGLRK